MTSYFAVITLTNSQFLTVAIIDVLKLVSK